MIPELMVLNLTIETVRSLWPWHRILCTHRWIMATETLHWASMAARRAAQRPEYFPDLETIMSSVQIADDLFAKECKCWWYT